MEELRKEFEKKTGYPLALTEMTYPTDTQRWAIEEILKKYIKFLEQKLSKQVTEEEFKMFIWNLDWSSDMEMEYKDYLILRIFSHYTLIPKE